MAIHFREHVILLCFLFITATLAQVTVDRTYTSSRRTSVSSIQVDNKIYFVGGHEYNDLIATDKIEVFNTIDNSWEKPLNLPVARGFVNPALDIWIEYLFYWWL